MLTTFMITHLSNVQVAELVMQGMLLCCSFCCFCSRCYLLSPPLLQVALELSRDYPPAVMKAVLAGSEANARAAGVVCTAAAAVPIPPQALLGSVPPLFSPGLSRGSRLQTKRLLQVNL